MSFEVRLRIESGRIVLYSQYSPSLVSAAKSVPGYAWNPKKKCWTFTATPFTAQDVVKALKKIDADIFADDDFKSLYRRSKDIVKASEYRNATELEDVPITKHSAWLHQRKAFHFAMSMPSSMLALGMGCGKTKVTIDIIQNRGHKRVLVVAPNKVVKNRVWSKEFAKHCVIPYDVIEPMKGSVEAKTAIIKKAIAVNASSDMLLVVVLNYESVWREPFGPSYNAKNEIVNPGFAMTAGFDLIVLDESHRAKSHTGKASTFLTKLAKNIPFKLALTGTPMPHSPLDIFAQYRILDPGIFGTSFGRFRSRYAVMGGYGGYQLLRYQNEEELRERFFNIAIQIGSEVLDLPPTQDFTLKTTLSRDGLRVYKELERDFVAELAEGKVTASNALTKLLRLQQLTGGYLPLEQEDGSVVAKHVDNAKAELLADTLEDLPLDEPVVVFCRFTADIENVRRIAKEQGRTCAILSGKEDTLQDWQDGKYNVLAVQIDAGGEGVDFTRSCYVIYYSVGYSLGKYLQSRARAHRPGQTRPTMFYHLVCEDTIDEKVLKALEDKADVVKSIIGERTHAEDIAALQNEAMNDALAIFGA